MAELLTVFLLRFFCNSSKRTTLFLYEGEKGNSTIIAVGIKIASTYGRKLFAQAQALFYCEP